MNEELIPHEEALNGLSVTPGIYQPNKYYSSPGNSCFLSILFLNNPNFSFYRKFG